MKGGLMDFSIKKDKDLNDDEIIIIHNVKSDLINSLQVFLLSESIKSSPLKLYKGDTEYFIKLSEILFFETYDNSVFAHTYSDAYKSDYRLYELEDLLSDNFIRISKSTIVNLNYIVSIKRNFGSSSTINFSDSFKEVEVSRKYLPILKEELEKRIIK